jgi:ATP-dependent Lon protease
MTGEVTLRGRVLAIGGLKEKTMAAKRSGITTVFIPADNVKDLEEIDQTVRASLRFVPVEEVDQVLDQALDRWQSVPADARHHAPRAGRSVAGQSISGLRQ